MKTLAKDTWLIAGQNRKNILLFELLYRGITLPVYLRFFNRGLRMALNLAGYSYLTAGNIGSFLARPWTMLIMAVMSVIGTMMLALETAGLITAFQGSAYYQKLTPLHILWGGLQKLSDEIWRHNWRLGLTLLMQYFLVNLLFICRALTHVKPVNFVIQEILKEPWLTAFLLVLLVLIMAASVPVAFVAYGCMVEQKSFSDSLQRSRSLMHGHKRRVLGLVIGCNLLVVFAVVAAYALSVFAAALFVVLFTDKTLAMAVLLSVADKLELGLIFLGSIFAMVGNYAALSVAYYQYGNRRFHTERWDFQYPAKGSASRRKMAAVLCVIMCTGLFYIFDLVRNGSALTDEILVETQITAHRGSSRSAPENTMAAMEAAIEELADSVELDVQLSADGVVVLGHDANLKRVAGINRAISSMTFEELRLLDVGSWFSEEFAGEQIPTLEEVMEVCRGRINLNIEIKSVGKTSQLPEKVVELVVKHGMEEQCVITSTSLNYLKQVKELEPVLRTGYIISAAYGNFYSSEAVDFISVRSSFVDERLVENVHAQGKGVFAWTVNSKSEMERLIMLGVDGIITDRPVLAREIIYREEATESLMEYLRMVFR